MMILKLESVRCACGWRGELTGRTPCPSCGAAHTSRISKEKLAVLRAIAARWPDGRPIHIPPAMRLWLVRRRLIVACGPPRPSSDGRRNPPARAYRLTALGELAIREDAAGNGSGEHPATKEASAP